MKAALVLEYVGAAYEDDLREYEKLGEHFGYEKYRGNHPFERRGACVLEMYRNDDGDIRHRFVHGTRDYSRANRKGTRGVMVSYVLRENRLYHVKSPQSWRSSEIYYAAVTPAGEVARVSDEDAQEWLNAL